MGNSPLSFHCNHSLFRILDKRSKKWFYTRLQMFTAYLDVIFQGRRGNKSFKFRMPFNRSAPDKSSLPQVSLIWPISGVTNGVGHCVQLYKFPANRTWKHEVHISNLYFYCCLEFCIDKWSSNYPLLTWMCSVDISHSWCCHPSCSNPRHILVVWNQWKGHLLVTFFPI